MNDPGIGWLLLLCALQLVAGVLVLVVVEQRYAQRLIGLICRNNRRQRGSSSEQNFDSTDVEKEKDRVRQLVKEMGIKRGVVEKKHSDPLVVHELSSRRQFESRAKFLLPPRPAVDNVSFGLRKSECLR